MAETTTEITNRPRKKTKTINTSCKLNFPYIASVSSKEKLAKNVRSNRKKRVSNFMRRFLKHFETPEYNFSQYATNQNAPAYKHELQNAFSDLDQPKSASAESIYQHHLKAKENHFCHFEWRLEYLQFPQQ